jgi:hypothetical protein
VYRPGLDADARNHVARRRAVSDGRVSAKAVRVEVGRRGVLTAAASGERYLLPSGRVAGQAYGKQGKEPNQRGEAAYH